MQAGYASPIPERFQWRAWVADPEGITGEALLAFVDDELFPTLKNPHPVQSVRRPPPRGARRVRGCLQLHEVRPVDTSGGQQDQRNRLQQPDRTPAFRRHLRADPQRPPIRRECGRVLHPPRRQCWSIRSHRLPAWRRRAGNLAPGPRILRPKATSFRACRILQEFALLMGLLKSYPQLARLRKAASIRNSSVVPLILSHGATEIVTPDFKRLSMMRSGMYGYRRSYSARSLIVVHDLMSEYNSLFSSSPWAALK